MAGKLKFKCVGLTAWDKDGTQARFAVQYVAPTNDTQAGGEVSIFCKGDDRVKLDGIGLHGEYDALPEV